MSWSFGKHPFSKKFWLRRKRVFARPKKIQFIDPKGRRLVGITKKTFRPIFAPKGHSLLLSSNGGGKSTAGGMVWLFSLLSSNPDRAIAIFDSKDGEFAWQTAEMIAASGRKVAILDDMGAFPDDHPLKVSLNPLGAVTSAYERDRRDLIFASENATYALVPEPENDERNAYWRLEPRTLIEFATYVLMKRNPRLAIPGGVWSLLGNPQMLKKMAEIEAKEGDGMLKVLALNVLEMSEHEHFPQHRSAALKALRIFADGARLHQAGSEGTLTHADLIREGYVIFIVGPQAYMNRLGAFYALHILAFNQALYLGAGKLVQILDEFTNAPLKPLVEALTTLRAFGAELHMIAQSRSEIERRLGKLEAETIEENAIVKQYFGFSSFSESERISQAIGEEQVITPGLSTDDKEMRLQFSYQTGKERNLSANKLMAMPANEQLIHVKGVGFIHALKISQQNLAPYCNMIAENPLEGGRLEPDPIFELPPIAVQNNEGEDR